MPRAILCIGLAGVRAGSRAAAGVRRNLRQTLPGRSAARNHRARLLAQRKVRQGGGPRDRNPCRLMAQSLLADRFKLEVAKGPKPNLKKAVDSDSDEGVFVNGAAMVGSSPEGWSTADLALFLSVAARSSGGGGPMVVDRTRLDGVYRFSLDFAVKGVNGADEVSAALQEQLGLKIENRNESVEVVIVDHIEKPDEN
jgi:uncharacterized protein (TIGR03435 family)